MSSNLWDQVLLLLQSELDSEDFRRWFSATVYASDSGDQLTVWVPSAAARQHISVHFHETLGRALTASGRPHTEIRFVVAGFGDDDDSDE